jgi:broad specificity phosphatase PhoE
VLKAAGLRRDYELNLAAWLAWHTAYLTVYAPQKSDKFPKLDKLTVARKRKDKPPEDWRDVLKRVEAWVGTT